MKKTLLISPPFYRLMGSHFNGISLGLSYIASVLKDNGYDVSIYNADYENTNDYLDQIQLIERYDQYKKILSNIEHPIWHEISDKISGYAPDHLGIQMFTATYKSAMNIATIAKRINPNIEITVGGTHPTLDPVGTLQSGTYDYAVFGEGEYTFLELIQGKKKESIPGLAFKNADGTIQKNNERKFIEDLDALPFPLRSTFLNDTEFIDIGAIITSRGCPFECAYCVSPTIWDKKVRFRSVQNILEELEYIAGSKIPIVRFQDDTFTLNKTRAIEICNGIVEKHLDIQWVCDSRVDRLDSELLQNMKDAGCIRLKVGVESGSDTILRSVKKGITQKQILETVSAIKEIGIPLTVYLMIGFPGETNEDVLATIRLANQINADYNSLSVVSPYYGTEIYSKLKKEGYHFENDHWEYFFHQSKDMILNTRLEQSTINNFFNLNNKGKGKRV